MSTAAIAILAQLGDILSMGPVCHRMEGMYMGWYTISSRRPGSPLSAFVVLELRIADTLGQKLIFICLLILTR